VSAIGIPIDSLETRVTDLELHKDDLCTASSGISDISTSLDDKTNKLQISEARLQMSETRQKALEREIVQLKAYSMKRNILFTIDVSSFEMAQEIKGENCSSIVRQFLTQKMGLMDVISYQAIHNSCAQNWFLQIMTYSCPVPHRR
jgi:hypothetical protein